jgi:hypothetical protein
MKKDLKELFHESPSRAHDQRVLNEAQQLLGRQRGLPLSIQHGRRWLVPLGGLAFALGLAGVLLIRRPSEDPAGGDLDLADNLDILETYAVSPEGFQTIDEEEDFDLIGQLEEVEQWDES